MKTVTNRYSVIFILLVFVAACGTDRYIFTLSSVTLDYLDRKYPDQNLRIKICDADHMEEVFATTESYPGAMTLPATFAIPALNFHLYKRPIAIQLWGDSTGVIATSVVNMDEYKIIYPIALEMKAPGARFTLHGSWE